MNNFMSTGASLGIASFSGIFGIFFCCLYIIFFVVGIALTVLWIWMLIDAIQRDEKDFGDTFGENSKLIWIILMLLFNGLTSIVYYYVVYKKYPKKGNNN